MAHHKFIVFCDGGLGNRLNALVAAKLIAQTLNTKLIVAWPTNNRCELSYDEIFDPCPNVQHQTIDINGLNSDLNDYALVAHEQQSFSVPPRANPNNEISWQYLIDLLNTLRKCKTTIYYNSTIPWCCPINEVATIVNELPWKLTYHQRAQEFLKVNRLQPFKFWGLHIRGTDFGHGESYYKRWKNIISLASDPVVICTDDPQVQNNYFSTPNVISRKIEHFVQRLHPDKDWNHQYVDDQNRTSNFNVFRGAESVKESIVDLMILSQSKIFFTSNSTFLTVALMMRGLDFSINTRILFWFRRTKQKIRLHKKRLANKQNVANH